MVIGIASPADDRGHGLSGIEDPGDGNISCRIPLQLVRTARGAQRDQTVCRGGGNGPADCEQVG